MRKTYRRKKEKPKQFFKKNHQITAPVLSVIDENGAQLGEIATEKAIGMAMEKGFDLVEVSPKATPPVAKFIDYGKFIYQKEKALQKQKAKQKKIDVKGIRLSLRIGDHDLQMKMDQAKKFLDKGHKVRIDMNLRGRENQYTPQGRELIQKCIENLKQEVPIEIEVPINKQGGKISTIIYKK